VWLPACPPVLDADSGEPAAKPVSVTERMASVRTGVLSLCASFHGSIKVNQTALPRSEAASMRIGVPSMGSRPVHAAFRSLSIGTIFAGMEGTSEACCRPASSKSRDQGASESVAAAADIGTIEKERRRPSAVMITFATPDSSPRCA